MQRTYGALVPQNPLLKSVYAYYAWTSQGGRLRQATAGLNATPDTLQDLRYTYDQDGNLMSIVDNKAGPQMQSFTYTQMLRTVKDKSLLKRKNAVIVVVEAVEKWIRAQWYPLFHSLSN